MTISCRLTSNCIHNSIVAVDYGRFIYDTMMTSVFDGVRCHCSPAMSITLRSLSTVHSQRQEYTPDSQECTVGSKASEAWQTFPVNNVSQFKLGLERIVD